MGHVKNVKRVIPPSVAGGIAGMLASAALQPLDILKSRSQVSGKATSMSSLVGDTFRWRTVYRGLSANLIASGFANTVFRYCFEASRNSSRLNDTVKKTLGMMPENRSQMKAASADERSKTRADFVLTVVSSVVAGTATTLLTHPLWLVKTRMELQQETAVQTHRWRQCIRDIWVNEGPFAYFRGIGAGLTLVSNGVIQMVVYEELKRRNLAWNLKPPIDSERRSSSAIDDFAKKASPWVAKLAGSPFVLGAASKLCASTLTYPLLVLRARQQAAGSPVANVNIFRLAQITLREYGGFRTLFSGMRIHVGRACLESGIRTVLFENLRRNA